MGELARGSVLDRPWGQTLAALAFRGLTGEVTVISDGKPYVVAFDQGIVVAASSPLGSDAAVRVALTTHLVSSTQVADIVRRQAAAPRREEIEVLVEAARLGPDQELRLRRRVIAQRAARTFSLDRGDFIVDDTISLPVIEGSALDIRTVVYLGAKQYVSADRLDSDVADLGAWFQIKPESIEDLPQFGFGDAEQAVVEALIHGAALEELDGPELDPRMVRAVVYALACCNMCITDPDAVHVPAPQRARAPVRAPTPLPTPPPPPPAAAAPSPPPRQRPQPAVAAPPAPPVAAAPPAPPVAAPAASAQRRPAPRASTEADPPAAARPDRASTDADAPAAAAAPAAASRRKADVQTLAVEELIKSKLAVLDKHPDHYALIGVGREATAAQIRTTYFALARQLHPDRLSALGIADDQRRAQRLFAELNTAFATLSDPKRRAEYTSVLQRGGSAAVRAEQAQAEELTQRVIDSEDAFRKGEMAIRRDQIETAIRELSRAVELNPEEADYHATLAWARFCGAPDKMAAAAAARKSLERAVKMSPQAVTARFYLGRVERMLGKDQDALRYFREVLEVMPHHVEAGSEVRALEARSGGDKGGGGLFGRLKR